MFAFLGLINYLSVHIKCLILKLKIAATFKYLSTAPRVASESLLPLAGLVNCGTRFNVHYTHTISH